MLDQGWKALKKARRAAASDELSLARSTASLRPPDTHQPLAADPAQVMFFDKPAPPLPVIPALNEKDDLLN